MPTTTLPTPNNLPLIGHLPPVRREKKLTYFENLIRKYGDIILLKYHKTDTYLVSCPDLIEDLMIRQQANLRKDIVTRTRLAMVLGQGSLVADGDAWQKRRRALQPAFKPKQLAHYARIAEERTLRLVREWTHPTTIDLHQEMTSLTLDVLTESIFGMDLGPDAKRVGDALDRLMDIDHVYGTLLPILSNQKMRRISREFDDVCYRLIENRKNDPGDDLLSSLITAEGTDKLTTEELRDEAVTLLLAGHETTALTLTYASWLLGVHPVARERLCEELEGLGDRPAAEHWRELTYTQAVIKEALRLYPPAWSIGREVTEPIKLRDHSLKPGDHVMFHPWSMHRDPRFWNRPEEFLPERWLIDEVDTLPRFAYFPFGGGPRVCIGKLFAEMEAAVTLATMWRNHEGLPRHGQRFRLVPAITLRPANKLEMTFSKRDKTKVSRHRTRTKRDAAISS